MFNVYFFAWLASLLDAAAKGAVVNLDDDDDDLDEDFDDGYDDFDDDDFDDDDFDDDDFDDDDFDDDDFDDEEFKDRRRFTASGEYVPPGKITQTKKVVKFTEATLQMHIKKIVEEIKEIGFDFKGHEFSVTCPECGSPMVKKVNRFNRNKFAGCCVYPLCTGTRDWNTLSRTQQSKLEDFQFNPLTGNTLSGEKSLMVMYRQTIGS